jgi:ribosomal protein S18 acetylase RimI-like enzyme
VISDAMIRPARASDATKLEAIARAAYVKYVARLGREPVPISADYPAAIRAGHAIVIERGNDIAGYLIGWPEPDVYFIDNVAVDPAHQGYGLGRALFQGAVVQAEKLKIPALRLYTNAAMTENLSLKRISASSKHIAQSKTATIASICGEASDRTP